MVDKPTRSEVAAALATICDTLLPYVTADEVASQKLRAVRNYVDTLFTTTDLQKLERLLGSVNGFVSALREQNIEAAIRAVEADNRAEQSSHVVCALQCVREKHGNIEADDLEAIWADVDLLCDLVA